jgi:hypothetical protein
MRAARFVIQEKVNNIDLFQDVNIRDVSKEAKIGWLKTIILVAVWPIIKSILLRKISPKLVDLIDDVVQEI